VWQFALFNSSRRLEVSGVRNLAPSQPYAFLTFAPSTGPVHDPPTSPRHRCAPTGPPTSLSPFQSPLAPTPRRAAPHRPTAAPTMSSSRTAVSFMVTERLGNT